ncbi:MAG: hypothetical protein HeimC3_36960 [Candidatus Heimdallarchaeota archaeon LC_3]|nr:MAG: hypothetical protein HeimC3_36960 [Candidatus Heimdallarchaeota archaeon LC_3]
MTEDVSQITLRLKGEIRKFFLKFQKDLGFQTDSQTIVFIVGQYMRFIGDEMRIVDLKDAREALEMKNKLERILLEIESKKFNYYNTKIKDDLIIELKEESLDLQRRLKELEK